jgi:hypothetical protein
LHRRASDGLHRQTLARLHRDASGGSHGLAPTGIRNVR